MSMNETGARIDHESVRSLGTLSECIEATLVHFNVVDSLSEHVPELEDVAEGLSITHCKLVELKRELEGRP